MSLADEVLNTKTNEADKSVTVSVRWTQHEGLIIESKRHSVYIPLTENDMEDIVKGNKLTSNASFDIKGA